MKFILDILNHLSNVAGIATVVFSILIWMKLKKKEINPVKILDDSMCRTEFERVIIKNKGISTHNPFALGVSLTGRSSSIRKDIENFLNKENMKMEIRELVIDRITHENTSDFFYSLKSTRLRLQAEGASEIHIFFSGPVQAAMIMGSIYDNWIPVKIYNLNPTTKEYEYWFPLVK